MYAECWQTLLACLTYLWKPTRLLALVIWNHWPRVGDCRVNVWGSNILHSVQLAPFMTDLMTNVEDRLNFWDPTLGSKTIFAIHSCVISFLASSVFCHLPVQMILAKIRTERIERMSVLIWIQTERIFEKKNILKKVNIWHQRHEKLTNFQRVNY